MPFSTLGRNRMLDALVGTATGSPVAYMSLHSAPPTNEGLHELSGGIPAYARQPITFGAAAFGSIATSAPATFDVPAGSTVAFVGLWSALTGGDFMGYAPSSGSGAFSSATASALSDVVTCPTHTLRDNDPILLGSSGGHPLPSPLEFDVIYYVSSSNLNSFKLALAPDGIVIDLLTDGVFAWQKASIDAFSVQGSITISSATFSLES